MKEETKEDQKLKKSTAIIRFIEKQKKAIVHIYQKTLLKYFIVIQSHWILTACFLTYVFKILNDSRVKAFFNYLCYKTEMYSRSSHFCFQSIFNDNIFVWKSEIIYRSLPTTTKRSFNKLSTILTSSNHRNVDDRVEKVSTNGDVYLLLTSIALINFVITLLIILLLIKSHLAHKKKSNKVNQHEVDCGDSLVIKSHEQEYIRIDANLLDIVSQFIRFIK